MKLQEVPTLTTPRLTLRALTLKDTEAYFKICSHPETMRSYGVKAHETLEQTKETIELLERWFRAGTAIRWGVFLKSTDELIGDTGFWRFDWVRHRGEIGSKIALHQTRLGYSSEALREVIECGFKTLGLHSIEAGVAPHNIASLNMITKLNFVKEGYRKEFSFNVYENQFQDSVLYTLLEPAWRGT